MGGMQGPQDASFPFMNFSVLSLVNVIKSDPAVAHVNAYTGGGNTGFIFMALKPLGHGCKEGSKGCDDRQASAMDVINRLRPKMNRLPLASAFMQPAQDLRIGGRGGNSLYQYTIQSDNIQDLAHWGTILLTNMKKIPDLEDVNTDQQNGGLQELLTYDRVTAARLGQTPSVTRQLALQRIRPVGSLGDLHAAEPVLRGDGGGAAVLAGSLGLEQHLFRVEPVGIGGTQRRVAAVHGGKTAARIRRRCR